MSPSVGWYVCCLTVGKKSTMKTGQINVQTENIFPIIKKFLYSDHEIFLRELVSNAVDASQISTLIKLHFPVQKNS
jgi:HSP90 family molecular chaperone